MLAEVADDLEERLLHGSEAEQFRGSAPEQALAREAQQGIVFAGGPGEVAPLHFLAHGLVSALDGPDPKPGKNDIDGEIGDARGAEERLRLLEFFRAQRPVPVPEGIGGDLQPGEQLVVASAGAALGAPAFQGADQLPTGKPMGGERETALGMVRRTDPVQPPGGAGQGAVVESIAFAPPEVPELAGMGVAGKVVGQETAAAEQAGLQMKGIGRGAFGREAGAQFGEAKHGPGILLVAEGAKEPFPKRLFPAGLAGAGGELGGLGFKPDAGRAAEQIEQPGLGKFAQGGAALAAQFGREGTPGFGAGPGEQFGERGVQNPRELKRGQAGIGLAGPDDVQDDVLESGVGVVAVRAPAAGVEIDLDIAGDGLRGIELDDRVAEVGSAFMAPEAGVQHENAAAIGAAQLIAEEALMKPDGLQQVFGGDAVRFAKGVGGAEPQAAFGVKIAFAVDHLATLFAREKGKVKKGSGGGFGGFTIAIYDLQLTHKLLDAVKAAPLVW